MKTYNVWLTKACNLKCKYCYEADNIRSDDKIQDMDSIINFIYYQSKDEGACKLNFHGGEPLIYFEKMKYIIRELNEKIHVKYFFTTNGMLLSADSAEYIKKHNISVSVSLDGTKDTNDLCRVDKNGRGTYSRVVEKLKELEEIKKLVRIRMTIVPETIHSLFDNVIHIVNLGYSTIVAVPDLFSGNWNDDNLKQLEIQLFRLHKQLKEKYDDSVSFTFFDEMNMKGRCSGGIEDININCNGDIYPCGYAIDNPKFMIGNVKTGIDSEKAEMLKKEYNCNNDDCVECNYNRYCISNRCKILNYMLTGNMQTAFPLICEFENIIFRLRCQEDKIYEDSNY